MAEIYDNDLPDTYMPDDSFYDKKQIKIPRANTPEDKLAVARGAMRKTALQAAIESGKGKVKEGAGDYVYQLNPDDSVTIVYDPTGRATGARLVKGGRQQKAYNAILEKEFGRKLAQPPQKKPAKSLEQENTLTTTDAMFGESPVDLNESSIDYGESPLPLPSEEEKLQEYYAGKRGKEGSLHKFFREWAEKLGTSPDSPQFADDFNAAMSDYYSRKTRG